jgi:hypothetical protein
VGIRYVSQTSNGVPLNLAADTPLIMNGVEYEQYIRLVKGLPGVLSFNKPLVGEFQGEVMTVDGIKVKVIYQHATSLEVEPIKTDIYESALPDVQKASLILLNRKKVDRQNEQDQINHCKS